MKYAEIMSELKALLEKIMDRYPDPEEERMDIWDEWIDQMDSKHPHPVDMEPFVLAGYKKIFDECYAELMDYLIRLTTLLVQFPSTTDEKCRATTSHAPL